MIYLRKDKELLEQESYIYSQKENNEMLIPIHDFDSFSTVCPRCGKIVNISIKTINYKLKEINNLDDLEFICQECFKKSRDKKFASIDKD